MEAYQKYLQPDIVAQLDSLELRARLIVEGFITGLHKSPYRGFSVEFAEHRQYRPGDEIRHIDWKIYSRTNRYYVKQYEEETNMRSMVCVDASASMKYSSDGRMSKYEYAIYLAAALCYLMMKQKDAAGLTIYDTDIRTFLPPRAKLSYLRELLSALDAAQPANTTGTAQALERVSDRISRRSFVVILSDFFDDVEHISTALKHLRHERHDVLCLQILDPREQDFDFGWAAQFRDLETGEEMVTQPIQIQEAYRNAMATFVQRLKGECYNANVDFLQISTQDSYDKALLEYMIRRNRRR